MLRNVIQLQSVNKQRRRRTMTFVFVTFISIKIIHISPQSHLSIEVYLKNYIITNGILIDERDEN